MLYWIYRNKLVLGAHFHQNSAILASKLDISAIKANTINRKYMSVAGDHDRNFHEKHFGGAAAAAQGASKFQNFEVPYK